MDLNELDVVGKSNEGFELQLVNFKTQEGLPLYITVLGKDSDVFRKLTAEQNRRRLAKMTKGNVMRLGSLSAEELEADAVELLAVCTVSWREQLVPDGHAVREGESVSKSTLRLNGEELACTRANATKLYVGFPWIREQVDTAIGDRANFIKG